MKAGVEALIDNGSSASQWALLHRLQLQCSRMACLCVMVETPWMRWLISRSGMTNHCETCTQKHRSGRLERVLESEARRADS